MTKKDITPEMLNTWIDKQRNYFQSNDPNSMNLINLIIKQLDNGGLRSIKEKHFKHQLLEYYENELTRAGGLVCDKCGNNLEIYYTSRCFHSDKPEPKVKMIKVCNLFMAMKYVKNNEPDFDYDEFWNELISHKFIHGNDTICHISVFKLKNMNIFKKHYNVDDNIQWEVSW